MSLARALGISAITATVLVSGCTSTVEGRAQDDGKGCKISQVTMQCYDPSMPGFPTTTSPTPTPQSNPIPAGTDGVKACDGDKCTFTAADDEISRLVSESLTDVAHMWSNLNVPITLTMYKNGTSTCDPEGDTATAWVCESRGIGGWDSAATRAWAQKRGATLEDTVRAMIAHELGHMVLAKNHADSADKMTNELRADCMAAGYALWTERGNGNMGTLTLARMKNVLYGDESARAIQAGYDGTPQTCARYER